MHPSQYQSSCFCFCFFSSAQLAHLSSFSWRWNGWENILKLTKHYLSAGYSHYLWLFGWGHNLMVSESQECWTNTLIKSAWGAAVSFSRICKISLSEHFLNSLEWLTRHLPVSADGEGRRKKIGLNKNTRTPCSGNKLLTPKQVLFSVP